MQYPAVVLPYGLLAVQSRTGFVIPSETFCALPLALGFGTKRKQRGYKPRRASLKTPPRFGGDDIVPTVSVGMPMVTLCVNHRRSGAVSIPTLSVNAIKLSRS